MKQSHVKALMNKTSGLLSTSDKPHYPYQLPEGWVWCKLDDYVLSVTDGDHQAPPKSSNGVPFLVISNIATWKIDFTNTRYVPKEYYENINEDRKAKRGDILFSVTGSYGIVVNVKTDQEFCFQRHIGLIKPVIGKEYLSYILMSGYIKGLCDNLATGTAQKTVGLDTLRSFFIPIAPIQEQKRIVAKIKQLLLVTTALECGKNELQTAIKQVKSKILDLAIHGKLVPQDPTDEPAAELLKRINPKAEITCDNGHYQKLPEGWVITSMQTLCALVDGEKQNGIERINLDVKYLRGEREAKVLTSGKYTAANTLLILVDGENSGEVFRAPVDGYQGSTFKQLSIHEEVYTDYVLQVINLHRKTLRENKVGSAIPHLNKKLFKAINVPIPPYEEQKRIVNAINKTFTILDTIMENL